MKRRIAIRLAASAAAVIAISFSYADAARSQQQPSFNCANNRAPNEVAICNNIALSQLDRQLSDLFVTVRDGLDLNQQAALRDTQRNWLRQRAACGADTGCIGRLYRQRIPQLRAMLAGSAAPPTVPVGPPPPVGTRPSPGSGTRDACDTFPTLCP
jgi:uncharacterized protein